LLQLLPFADEEIIDKLEENLKTIPPISTLVEDKTLEEIAAMYLKGIDFELFDSMRADYRCVCSRKKTDGALISLGKAELEDMIKEGSAELRCQFCDIVYNYSAEELKVLLDKAKE